MLRVMCLSFMLFISKLALAASPVILSLTPKSGPSIELTAESLALLPQKKMTMPTPWFQAEQTFEGPLLRDVLKLANIQDGNIKFTALNDYAISIPVSDAFKYDVVLASKRNGKVMTIRDKGPLFVIYPFHHHPELRHTEYFRRCSWQLRSIKAE